MSSCATIFCGSKARVTFESDITEKATLTIDGRKHTDVTFPYTPKIKRRTRRQSRGPVVYDRNDRYRQVFQHGLRNQPDRHPRLGYRCGDRSNDETGIQILSDRFPAQIRRTAISSDPPNDPHIDATRPAHKGPASRFRQKIIVSAADVSPRLPGKTAAEEAERRTVIYPAASSPPRRRSGRCNRTSRRAPCTAPSSRNGPVRE